MRKFFAVFFIMLLFSVPSALAAAPQNVIVQPENGRITISWKNPSGAVITDIDVVNQSGQSVAGTTLSKTAGAVNVVPVEGLTNDKKYIFKIRITAGGETDITEVSAVPADKNKQFYTADGYNLSKWEWKGGGNSIVRTIDTEEKHEGNSSMKIVSNYLPDSYLQTNANYISLNDSKSYRLTFWAKLANNANNKVQYMNDWKNPRYTISGNEWKQYTWDISGTNSLIFRIIVETTCDALWIDDIQLHEMNGEEIVGENLFPQGNFEFEAYDFEFDGTGLSWTEPDNVGFKGVDIFQEKQDGTRIQLNDKLVEKGTAFFELPENALIDESYDILVTSNIDDIRTPGAVYKVYGKVDYFDAVLSSGGKVINELVPGEITVTKSVQNNKMGNDFKASLILALYKDDELIEMNFSEKTLPEDMQKKDIVSSVTIPDDGEKYELQVFLWNDLEEMEILKSCESFNN